MIAAVGVAVAVAAGFALGLAYFAALRANVRLYADGRPAAALAVHAARTAVVVAAAVAAARAGAVPLLAALAGFVAARTVVVRRTP